RFGYGSHGLPKQFIELMRMFDPMQRPYAIGNGSTSITHDVGFIKLVPAKNPVIMHERDVMPFADERKPAVRELFPERVIVLFGCIDELSQNFPAKRPEPMSERFGMES